MIVSFYLHFKPPDVLIWYLLGAEYSVRLVITQLQNTSLTCSSHNPVGKVFSKAELQAIGDICIKNNVIILSDEVRDFPQLPRADPLSFPD